MHTEEGHEEHLTGGNASESVVRIGTTVRKPWLKTTERTMRYMRALRERGVDLPEPHGRDSKGRLILDFVPGRLAMDEAPLAVEVVHAAGAAVRTIHDASVGLPFTSDWEVLLPAKEPTLLCHNDLATWNLVVDGDRLVFIDWDGAGPSTRLWDLAYAAISFGHLFPDVDPRSASVRLAAFVDGYRADLDLRSALPQAMTERSAAMYDLLEHSHQTGREPWGSMYAEGHGRHWLGATSFIAKHQGNWQRAVAPA